VARLQKASQSSEDCVCPRWEFRLGGSSPLRPLTFRLFKPSAFAQTGGVRCASSFPKMRRRLSSRRPRLGNSLKGRWGRGREHHANGLARHAAGGAAPHGVAAGLGPPGAEGVCRPAISGRRAAHPEGLGPVEKIGYLARQTQFTFRRCCIIPVGLVARQALALATFS
jgi:hypothetical protein